MAKLKLAKKKKGKAPKAPGAIPCVVLLISGIVLLSLLLFAILRSS